MKSLFSKDKMKYKAEVINVTLHSEVRGILNTLDLNINDLGSILENYNTKEKEFVISSILNDNLSEIKGITKLEYSKIEHWVDTVMSFYTSDRTGFNSIIKKVGNKLANQILFEEISYNEKNNCDEVDIAFIKNKYLSSIGDENTITSIFAWIILKYIAIQRSITFFQVEEDDEDNF